MQSLITFHLGALIENLTLTGNGLINGTGNTLDNVITGNISANTLNGLGGADTVMGGRGDDTYYVDNSGDVVIENANEGFHDKVVSSVDFALGDNIKNLTITGADTFVFGQGSGADVIKDFSASQNDSIDLSAYTHGTADLGLLHQSGVHTVIDLGGGNTITVQNITTASLQSHIHW